MARRVPQGDMPTFVPGNPRASAILGALRETFRDPSPGRLESRGLARYG